ncbi:MAG TPA: acetyl-CoA C-acetyltransferase [Candidatus Methylomirabilis sp.]|nr:acetyl-CoA C-acetyltransferase [Candidatus Methylomirabilis sp.]
MEDVVIVGAARTPIGSFGGRLASVPATRLGSVAAAEALRRAGVDPQHVDETIFGNVLSAGLGQAPARQVAIGAKVPASAGALTVNKVCGSGLMAVMLAANRIQAGEAELVLAGGMESMSRAPYLLDRARTGYRMGHAQMYDSMILDGLWDVYNQFSMGLCGELCADRYHFTREAQDEYAARSYTRALAAQAEGRFSREIVPVEVPGRKGAVEVVDEDEEPKHGDLVKMRTLKPAFKEGGTVTAANSPSVNDGAAALVVVSARRAEALGLEPMARIAGMAGAATAPEWFTVAPIDAVRRLFKKTGRTAENVDLFEINEAFSVVTMAANQDLGLDPERVNVNGGAVALGHPVGATGARILVTLLYAMAERGAGCGIAALCLGGGEAVALAVERN